MHKLIKIFSVAGFVTCIANPVFAQDEDATEVPEGEKVGDEMRSCVTLRSLRRTEVIDDSTVLFRMRGRTTFLNILPRRCGGLAREDRFSYDSRFGRLCAGDMIRVLYIDSFGPSHQMREGAGCRLGSFQKISQEEAKALREGPPAQVTPAQLPMPAPQEVGGGTAEDEESLPE